MKAYADLGTIAGTVAAVMLAATGVPACIVLRQNGTGLKTCP
ncbi:hypothetical protein NXV13_22250 [Bacteroides ovatus]|nr:hypothetical protein [Bacteroides ovatus]